MINEKHSNNKSDTTKIIAQTNYKVSNVAYSVATEDVNFTEPTLTWLPDSISHKNKEPISLQELERRVNTYKKQNSEGEKINHSGFLKGLYSGYFSGPYCTKTVPYLCFDIDVKDSDKPEENKHLLDFAKNQRVFEELKKLSVLTWRSNSGYGIAGILYVPQIVQYTSKTSIRHNQVGIAITTYLSDYLHQTTGIESVIFDKAQSKFRQVRLVADQQGIARKLNPRPFVFSYTSEEVVRKTITGVTNYQFSDYRLPGNSIFSQFNSDNKIADVLRNNGFTIGTSSGGKKRVKHFSSSSTSSGFIDEANNVYVNFSNSFDSTGKVRFTPSHIVCKNEFGNNWKEFAAHLYNQGYKDKPIEGGEVQSMGLLLKDALKDVTDEEKASEIIFKHCFNFKYASNQMKRQFIADNCTRPEFRKHFVTHLNFSDYKIPYDKKLTIDSYVAEVLPQVLDYADIHNKVILRADTGRGKTTAFIRDFHTHRPDARILILASLTIIVDQNEKEYGDDAIFLTGNSDGFDHEKARNAKLVFATYEQGTKHLSHHTFDYIVIDEVHQLLTANAFKADVIGNLTVLLKDTTTIGLTGTPSEIFSLLDYKLLNIDVEEVNLM